ncbi:MAG: amidohydrolase family protein, partial [Actinomycetota bacterium]|nr:amidohydrolase family protein [Actinomycetota bacterium]
MKLDRLEWINSGQETPIDSTQRIIDPHHHLWEREGFRYRAEELSQDTARGHAVSDTVFVECLASYRKEEQEERRSIGETEFVVEESVRSRELKGCDISGINAFIDLSLGDKVNKLLDAHQEVSGKMLKGVRHATAWSNDPKIPVSHSKPREGLMAEKAFIDGVRYLGNRNLSFDAWMYFDQLHQLHNLAKEVPNTRIIINHLGAPLNLGKWQKKQAEMHSIWKSELRKLAKLENVYLKIGGIGMENYFGTNWGSRPSPPSSDEVVTAWDERILWCIERFGTEKCMFESNYPVDRQTLPYSVIWNTFQKITQSFTMSEKDDLF